MVWDRIERWRKQSAEIIVIESLLSAYQNKELLNGTDLRLRQWYVDWKE